LIDRRRQSCITDVRSFGAADCDTDNYLVVEKVRERLAMRKKKRVHMERFNLKKLNEAQGTEQYGVAVSNRFTALENLYTEVDINRDWETVRILTFLPKRVYVIMN
jgi:hypothetical protein